MKIFKHAFMKKKYLVKLCLYRRLCRNHGGDFTFTIEDMEELFLFESRGISTRPFDEMKAKNGFVFGKWLRDLTVSMIVEDVSSGLFPKIFFLKTGLDRIHNLKVLEKVLVRQPVEEYKLYE